MVYVINNEHLTRRKLVTIDGSKVTTETDIPLGLNINLPGVKATGADIRLAKLDGTPLAREIECIDVPNTNDAMIWYQWDTTVSQNDQFYVYWGNSNLTEPAADSTYGSEAIWDSDFTLAYLMNDDPNGDAANSITDSTSNDNHGTPHGSMTSADLIDSEYGKALDLDGSNDYIESANVLTTTNDFTITVIMLNQQLSSEKYYLSLGYNNADSFLLYALSTQRYYIYDYNYVNSQLTTLATSTNYARITIKKNDTEITAIVNDASEGRTSTSHSISQKLQIGYAMPRNKAGTYFDGYAALVIYSDIARSDNYIATQHNNYKNPTATGTTPFYLSFGSEQHQRKPPVFIG